MSVASSEAEEPLHEDRPLGRLRGRVAASMQLGGLVWLTLDVPGWPGARPGQFALVQPEPSRCFLARALSVAGEAGESVSFLIAPVGQGTRELCELRPGGAVGILGPLGNGFDLVAASRAGSAGAAVDPSRSWRLLVVAGGVGVAPFPLLIEQMGDRVARESAGVSGEAPPVSVHGPGLPEIVVLVGFREEVQARAAAPLVEAVSQAHTAGLSCRLAIAVEDGSAGPPERVTDLLTRELRRGDRLFVCGPEAMSAAVWQSCCRMTDVRAWFSMETDMACGVGSCHGCVLTLADGSMARVCRDGPVFAGEQVFGRSSLPPEGSEWRETRS